MSEINLSEGFIETMMSILDFCKETNQTAVTLDFDTFEIDIEFRMKEISEVHDGQTTFI